MDFPMTDPNEPLFHAPEHGQPIPYINGRKVADAAAALSREFGEDAGMAAALRAAQSRARDNPVTFCHWREVERLVGWMHGDDAGTGATRH